jgi:hypothetical protein
MRRISFLSAASLIAATTAAADTSYSALIADQGLKGAATTLAAISEPTPSDQFALGGIRFLQGVEHTLQQRYRTGMHDGLTEMSDLPFLRLPIYANPDPEPFTPDLIERLFETVVNDMNGALTPLDTITNTDDVAVTIDTSDLWFDINMNGTRETGEGFFGITGMELDRALADGFEPPVVTFDTADAAWLSAYAHLLSGVSEVVLALDTETAIRNVVEGGAMMDAMRGTSLGYDSFIFTDDTTMFIDLAAMFIGAIEGQPDPAHTNAALTHWQGMIADNKLFWSRVAAETDNHNEWIPNKRQTSALPIPFPPETGQRWRAILADAEGILNGRLLIPHWRLGDDAGLNFAEIMRDPPEIDIAGFIQGWSLTQYATQGRVIDSRNLQAFEQLLGGDAPFYAVILN